MNFAGETIKGDISFLQKPNCRKTRLNQSSFTRSYENLEGHQNHKQILFSTKIRPEIIKLIAAKVVRMTLVGLFYVNLLGYWSPTTRIVLIKTN